MANHVKVGNVTIGNDLPFVLIAGPCQLESRDHAMFMAENLKKLCTELNIPLIYKTSYDKANRSSIKGVRGLGLEKSLEIFDE
ncbi:MAG: 3-deoxy-8-phosphooctulonate synthase, partial [Alphaproteobacteria bacterium]|nr:3-deoxy-8-phosphooctulonate synthase [Alphaproteobacteria bacterium]